MLTATVAVTVVGLAVVGGWRLSTLRREVAMLRGQINAGMTVRTDAQLDQFWAELCQLHQQHAATVEARVQRTEATAAHTAVDQSQLAQRVDAIEQWVKVWAAAARNPR